MATKSTARISVSFKLSNGRTVCLTEGDLVKGLLFKEGNDLKVINGIVRVLNANTKNYSIKNAYPPEPYISNLLNITSIIIDSSTEYDADLKQISIGSIIDIDDILENDGAIKIGVGDQYGSLSNVINSVPAGSTIELLNGVYEDNITITKSIKLVSATGAIVRGNITVNGQTTKSDDPSTITEVVLDGLYMSGNSKIVLNNVNAFSMQNCVYKDHNFTTAKTMPILINLTDHTPIKVNIDNNEFGIENENSYNMIEVHGDLKTGSSFNGNRFDDGCCTHNQINLYALDNGAIIDINDNYCAVSKNMVRIGFKGNPNGTVEMRNNTYIKSDIEHPDYAGLFLVQPFGKETVSMKNLRILVSNTTKPNGQLCYMYAGSNDMQFTDATKPTIIVDGKEIEPVVIN